MDNDQEQQGQQDQQHQPAQEPYNPFKSRDFATRDPDGDNKSLQTEEPADGNQQQEPSGDQQQGDQQQPGNQQQAPSYDPAEHQRMVEEAVQKAMQTGQNLGQQQQTQPNKELSEEEYRKAINYFEVDADTLSRAMGVEVEPEQVKQFNNMLQSVAKQAATMGALYAQDRVQQVQQMVSPVLEQHEQHQFEQQKQFFFERHKDLKGYDELVTALGVQMRTEIQQGRGQGYKTMDEAADALAKRVRDVIKVVPGAQQGQQQGNQQQQNNQQTQQNSQAATRPGKMAPVNTTGGQSSSGSDKGTPRGHPDAVAVFGGRRR